MPDIQPITFSAGPPVSLPADLYPFSAGPPVSLPAGSARHLHHVIHTAAGHAGARAPQARSALL